MKFYRFFEQVRKEADYQKALNNFNWISKFNFKFSKKYFICKKNETIILFDEEEKQKYILGKKLNSENEILFPQI